MKAPIADKRPHSFTRHGVTIEDEYAWLRADNWQEVVRDPAALAGDICAYLEAENAYMAAQLSDTEALQKNLFAEMKGRIKEDDSSVPTPDGPWDYYTSFVTGGEYPRICRRPRGCEDEHVLLDGNAMGAGLSYFAFGGVAHSHDHRHLAYSVDDKGSEYYTLRIRDLDNGEDLDDEVPDTSGGAVWSRGASHLFYVRLDENHRPMSVYRHRVGTPASEDVLVYREPDKGFYVHLATTQSRKYILISTGDHQTSEIRLIEAATPEATPTLVSERDPGHEYDVDHIADRLIIRTNADGAEDFKIMSAPEASPGKDYWQEIEPHRSGRLILDVGCLENHLIRLERENGLPRIVIRRWSDGTEHEIAFDEEAYSLGVSPGYEFQTTKMRFTYSSMTTPAQTYDYDVESRERSLRKTQEVPSGHEASDYVTRRLMAPAHDGETVPISLLYHKSTQIDGSAPLLLYGYGSYGLTMPASFSTDRLSLVDRGFVYAIAHIRGSKAKGYRWYKQGKLDKKTNTFKDFISAGNFLADQAYTSKGRIVAHGASAGGLLMGAVANMAHDLFLGLIAQVPFVDVLNTILDDSLPLTPLEWLEWGNPIESAAAFETIRSYSPYDNVARQSYPHMLVMAGLTDPRVTYWEPAKWVARLRDRKTDQNLLLLKTNMEAGHGGASGRFKRLEEVALAYAFALKIVGNPAPK